MYYTKLSWLKMTNKQITTGFSKTREKSSKIFYSIFVITVKIIFKLNTKEHNRRLKKKVISTIIFLIFI